MDIIRPDDLARRLGVAKSTLYEWEKRRGFPRRIKLGPRTSGWKRSEVDEWLERHRVGGPRG